MEGRTMTISMKYVYFKYPTVKSESQVLSPPNYLSSSLRGPIIDQTIIYRPTIRCHHPILSCMLEPRAAIGSSKKSKQIQDYEKLKVKSVQYSSSAILEIYLNFGDNKNCITTSKYYALLLDLKFWDKLSVNNDLVKCILQV